jgi:hypothetical protein
MSKCRVVFSALASLILVPAVWSLPKTHNPVTFGVSSEQAAAQAQSVSGKIASVEKTSFTLTVGAGSSNLGQQLQGTSPKTMQFLVDKNTTIDGQLKVGAAADVTYRVDDGQNVAISVRVGP